MSETKVKIQLRDPGSSITIGDTSLKGVETAIVTETENIISLRKKGVIITEAVPDIKLEKPAKKNSETPEKDGNK